VPTVLWFRRDLRLADNPALLAAVERAAADGDGRVVPLVVIDPALWGPAGDARRASFIGSLRSLDARLGGQLLLRHGPPEAMVTEVARAAGASEVHIAADFAPYGSARDERVGRALAGDGVRLVRTGSPYAVAPGRVVKGDGTPYRVYTPFYRAWLAHGWRRPAEHCPDGVEWWMPMACDGYPPAPPPPGSVLPEPGEPAALARWDAFRASGLATYDVDRDRPDLLGTSTLSAALKWGELHPRTLLGDLDDSPGAEVFRKELAWREFYADVMLHHPTSVRDSLDRRFDWIRHDEGPVADERFEAWCAGRTGFPFVDAGMRQLAAEGWMHNRVRMVVASFLVKDLHLPWWRGARWFMRMLRDGDVASNSHGWQWAAGCGTDAAPYFRVFNPVSQGLKFDPAGDYVRRWVPELAEVDTRHIHDPSALGMLAPADYPAPMVDHGAERNEALARYKEISGQ